MPQGLQPFALTRGGTVYSGIIYFSGKKMFSINQKYYYRKDLVIIFIPTKLTKSHCYIGLSKNNLENSFFHGRMRAKGSSDNTSSYI
jgi:hypothetical protein